MNDPTQDERDAVATAIIRAQGFHDDEETLEPLPYDACIYDAGAAEYLVLTDEEADERTANYIRESLWAFNASFLVSYVPEGVGEDVLRMIGEKCEDGNASMLGLVGDRLDELTADAISADGRGHFLATYDGEEIEEKVGDRYWYAYRI